jgi:hypothetical protein
MLGFTMLGSDGAYTHYKILLSESYVPYNFSVMFLSLFLATIATPLVSHPVLALNSPGLVTPVQHYGPELTVEHLFYNDMPVGVGVSGSGRKFVTYTRPSNYTLAELIDDTHDVPWPSFDIQNLPSLVNSTDPTYAVNYQDRLINIQNVVCTLLCLSSICCTIL